MYNESVRTWNKIHFNSYIINKMKLKNWGILKNNIMQLESTLIMKLIFITIAF